MAIANQLATPVNWLASHRQAQNILDPVRLVSDHAPVVERPAGATTIVKHVIL
jgi:hypothetical protein